MTGKGRLKKMKKIITSIIGIILVISVVSCGVDKDRTEHKADISQSKQVTKTIDDIANETKQESKTKITEQIPIHESLTAKRNIVDVSKYISYKWFTEQEEKIIAKNGDILSYPFEVTNISKFDFEIEFPYMKNVTITNSSGETIKQTMLGSSESLELTVNFEIDDNRKVFRLYGGGFRFDNAENEIFGSTVFKTELIKVLFVKRTDAPDHKVAWERDLNNQHVELLPEIEVDDYILLINYHDNSEEAGIHVFYDVWYSFTYINSKTGEEVWNIPEDVFGDKKIVDYYEFEDYLVFYTDSFEFLGASFNKKEYKPLKIPYLADKHSGEILFLDKSQITRIVNKQKLDRGIKFEVYRHKEGDSNIASIYDVEQNKVIWKLAYDKMFDFQITDDAIYFSYSLADSDIHSGKIRNIVSKYSFDGMLQKQNENPEITIFVYSHNNLFFESGRIDFADIRSYESMEFLYGFINMAYVDVHDISLINKETLEPIWTKEIHEYDELTGSNSKIWDRWYFEKEEMIAFSNSKITAIDISNGDVLWEMEPELSTRLNTSNTQVNDGYLEVLSDDNNLVPPYKKEFYEIKTGEILPDKTEFIPKYQLGFEKKISSDGYIVLKTEWYDPETFELIGSIAEDEICYDRIIDIRDGYIYYQSSTPVLTEELEDKFTTYLICKKIE